VTVRHFWDSIGEQIFCRAASATDPQQAASSIAKHKRWSSFMMFLLIIRRRAMIRDEG
jgi:hypothetical protein